MSIDRENLAPFISLLLLRTDSSSGEKKHVGETLTDVKQIVESIDDHVERTLLGVGQPGTRGGVTSGFLHYEEKRRPTWIRGDPPNVFDRINQFVVVSQAGDLLVICTSSKPLQEEISRTVRLKPIGFKTIGELFLLDSATLNAALIGELARTLWLAGLHKRTAVKADNKILSGVSLRDALDPLGDQTYTFSAIRSELPAASGVSGTVGVTPRKAALWTRPSRSWGDFQEQVAAILTHLAGAVASGKTEETPLPVLATPVVVADSVHGAYDMSIIAPELLADDPLAVPTPDTAKFAYDVHFELTSSTTSPNFQAAVLVDNGEKVGVLEFRITIEPNGSVDCAVEIVGKSNPTIEAAKVACSRSDSVTVYYESGHTLSGDRLFRPQFRDMRFKNWSWQDFSGYHVHREKPLSGKKVAFDEIGSDKSLFSWVINTWPASTDGSTCWIACDDGANEVADFVVLKCGGKSLPVLSLVHVKASKNKKVNRQLSTSDFEIVTSQAIKNLRSLERRNLSEFLKNGAKNKTKMYAWMNGKRVSDRSKMLVALDALGANFEKEVVIVQPSARKIVYEQVLSVNTKPHPGWYYRRAQLDTLLLEAQNACFGLGATMRVVADDS